jgi:hypothetical protein
MTEAFGFWIRFAWWLTEFSDHRSKTHAYNCLFYPRAYKSLQIYLRTDFEKMVHLLLEPPFTTTEETGSFTFLRSCDLPGWESVIIHRTTIDPFTGICNSDHETLVLKSVQIHCSFILIIYHHKT